VIRGIVLAAGFGRRIGIPKALLTIREETFHARAVRVLRANGLSIVSVVNSAVDVALGPPLADETRIINPDPDEGGMFGSVRLAIEDASARGAASAVLLPVDHALVTIMDVAVIVAALRDGAAIALPVFEGRRGHPVGVSQQVMREILEAPPGGTLKELVHKEPGRVVEVPASFGVVTGINTQADLDRASILSFR